MAGVIFRGSKATPEQDERIRLALDTSRHPAPAGSGMRRGVHDGVSVMEVWASEDAAQGLSDAHLVPAMGQADMVAERSIFPIIGTIHP